MPQLSEHLLPLIVCPDPPVLRELLSLGDSDGIRAPEAWREPRFCKARGQQGGIGAPQEGFSVEVAPMLWEGEREQQVQRPSGISMTLDRSSRFQHKLCPDSIILVENGPAKANPGVLS